MMRIDPVERWNLAISAGAVATSLAVAPPVFTTSLAVGAALEAANFRALRRSAQFLFWGVMPGQRAWAAVTHHARDDHRNLAVAAADRSERTSTR
jgi:hypothetical protein